MEQSQVSSKSDEQKAGHTPGPWIRGAVLGRYQGNATSGSCAGQIDIQHRSEHTDGRVHAIVYIGTMHGDSLAEGEANARLISAAPDLLAACKACADSSSNTQRRESAAMCRAAIAKATGGAL